MTKKQLTLFPEDEVNVIPELELREAEIIADKVKFVVETHCEKIQVAGSVRRRKNRIHDVDFVVITRTDAEWQKINEELGRLKAKHICSGNNVIKAFLPCQIGLFQVDFYRAKPLAFGIQLLVRTGSADHNIWLAGYAISKEMRIKYSEGVIKDDRVIAGKTEEEVFETLGLPCLLPSEREIVESKPIWMLPHK